MYTYKATLRSTQGCDYSIIMVGDSVQAAIKDFFLRKKEVAEILTISEPYKPGEYHIEHSGREITLYKNYGHHPKTIYCDTITEVEKI